MKLNTITHKSAVVASAAACIATSTLHGATLSGSQGIDMGYSAAGRIIQARPIADISSNPAAKPNGWYTSGLSDVIVPVAQFTGYDPNAGANLPVVDLIPLRTPRIEVTTNGSTGGVPTMLAQNGRVGIGTASPSTPLHVATGAYGGIYQNAGRMISMYADPNSNTLVQTYSISPGGYGNMSIYAEGAIVSNNAIAAGQFHATRGYTVTSDSRIKDVSGVSDAAEDLGTLNRIPIKNYTLKDKVRYGTRSYKKVVAQDVEAVFPLAVEKTTKAVPDVMLVADAASAGPGVFKLTLPKETGLKAGDRVEFRNQEDTPETAGILSVDGKVLTVALNGAKDGGKVLVYGREVNDFLTVDYDALSMLNVSATQELSRKVAALETENAQLRKLAAKVEKMESLVAALEGKANGTVTVSLNK